MNIEFRAKVKNFEYLFSGGPSFDCVYVPKLGRRHCDMGAFRVSKAFGGVANSSLFDGVLERIKKHFAPHGYLRLDKLPAGVRVDTRGYLAIVTIDVPDEREIINKP